MKKITIIVLVVTGLFLCALPVSANVYVSDKLEVPLRNGPGTTYRIVDMLRSGQVVEVLSEKAGWSHVRLAEGARGREGWILSRYLMNREPWDKQVKALEEENARLRETASPLAQELRDLKTARDTLATELKEKTEKLDELERNYEVLQKESSTFLDLREKFERTRAELANTEHALAERTRECELLRSSHSYKWFLSGALVLFTGLLVGLIMGRREKKRSSKLYL
ncbi:MAG TPA: TIGR04211 family SH3 domain-containing protein [Deltaproteobacteria bacterium]|nr:TIGR04211 family SH3 domain-containing protein [Deltaproteobacteria bacterium]